MVEEPVCYADLLDDADWFKSLTRDPFDTPMSVNSCVINSENRPLKSHQAQVARVIRGKGRTPAGKR